MLVGRMVYRWGQEGAGNVEIDLAHCAAVGEGGASGGAGVAEEGAAGVSRPRDKDEWVQPVVRVLYIALGVAAVLVEEEVAAPAGVDRVLVIEQMRDLEQ